MLRTPSRPPGHAAASGFGAFSRQSAAGLTPATPTAGHPVDDHLGSTFSYPLYPMGHGFAMVFGDREGRILTERNQILAVGTVAAPSCYIRNVACMQCCHLCRTCVSQVCGGRRQQRLPGGSRRIQQCPRYRQCCHPVLGKTSTQKAASCLIRMIRYPYAWPDTL